MDMAGSGASSADLTTTVIRKVEIQQTFSLILSLSD